MDFFIPTKKNTKNGIEVYPKFVIKSNIEDLMIRGQDFYAIWDEENGLWSTNEGRALEIIDKQVEIFGKQYEDAYIKYLWDAESGMIDKWHHYCKRQLRDSYVELDSTLIFANDPVSRTDYGSKKLPYDLADVDTPAYNELMSVIYSAEERLKIEWAIGSIIAGDSKNIQKFLVLYGDKGTGKSTVLNIIEKLFDGYYAVFDAKALGSANDQFALEPFRNNPLVAIQHDGDLSRIEDNTRLNSLVSHEIMTVNEKFKSAYSTRFVSFLFMGTNKPVRITDSKSGILRRLIDVSPTGKKVSIFKYNQLKKAIDYELGGIAKHCLDIYESNKNLFDNYIPTSMFGASNDFYNYILDSYDYFITEEVIPLKKAWIAYKEYCDDARVPYPLSLRLFKEELKNYFDNFDERYILSDGTRIRSAYRNFNRSKIEGELPPSKITETPNWLIFKEQSSVLDEYCKDCPAQYSNERGTPQMAWADVETTLKDIDTSKEHYVRVPKNLITIDLDIPDEHGNKSLEKNLEAAAKFPMTYAELSKSGNAIHLEYLYSGNVEELSNIYSEHIEIKKSVGKSALRRKLTRCNDLMIATLTSGLPLIEKKKMINEEVIKDEKHLRNLINKQLRKETHGNTTQSIQYIVKLMNDAYAQNLTYDLTNMKKAVEEFALHSSHQSEYCYKLIQSIKWSNNSNNDISTYDDDLPITFFDVEVFPNLFVCNYKVSGDKQIKRLINPSDEQIKMLCKHHRLVGFNNRRYDNHILYARMLGYSNEALFKLSRRIIKGDRTAFFSEAYNLSYTDIYDFASKKQSLKKYEIEIGFTHVELGLPWDKEVPEEMWETVAEYCDNDVLATEALFKYLEGDWLARKILCDLTGGHPNMTTNTLSTILIFGNNKEPQNEFKYRNLGEPVNALNNEELSFLADIMPEMINSRSISDSDSWLPYFPGYKFDSGKSTYRGELVSEGGYVYAEPGIYYDAALLDIGSMHPHSAAAEITFGVRYTKRFYDLVKARLMIKHGKFDKLSKHMDGLFEPYIKDISNDPKVAKNLAQALKIVINSVYGLTKAHFDNPFKDPRNIDNIVAKRGALFMIDLKHAVQEKGFTVVHIKTDSIKIANATPEIIQFVYDFGKLYGYTFEHEATYERICLIDKAQYIAKDAKDGYWTATGKTFIDPYIFKTLFSKEPILLDDVSIVNSVKDSNIYISKPNSNEKIFIGKVGQFTPVIEGANGGELVKEVLLPDGTKKYDYVQGSKGFLWKQTEELRKINNLDFVDWNYFKKKADEVIQEIEKYGNFDEFRGE